MKILLFGPRGYLGQQFQSLYPNAVLSEVDIADAEAVSGELDRVRPEVVINAAGKTGKPNVDWCEDHKAETLRSNVTGPLVLLNACGKHGIYWVQMSTGCIYEGNRGNRSNRSNKGSRQLEAEGFTEEDPPNFFGSFYSRTKGWIDQILKEFPVLQLRLRMPFDASRHERNLIMKLTQYSRVLDVPNSITYLPDFLDAARALIAKRATGIYNVVNPGALSPFAIMEMYRTIVDPAHRCERLTLEDLPRTVKAGRSNCILSTKKLEGEGIRLRPVEEAITEALEKLSIACWPSCPS